MQALPVESSSIRITVFTCNGVRKKTSHFVLTNRGKSSNILKYLDKYEGDAIIAFWNAPLGQPA